MANVYVGSVQYTAVTAWAAGATLSVGNIRRPLTTPAVGSERCYRVSAITTGITAGAEPTWPTTKNGTVVDGGVTWTECSGQAVYNGDGGGSLWGAPHARLENAQSSTFAAAGDTICVASDHTQTAAAALTLTGQGTAASPVAVVCVSPAAAPPTAKTTGASIATTGANALSIRGFAYYYGITFSAAGGGANAANLAVSDSAAAVVTLDTCVLTLATTSTSAVMLIGQNGSAKDVMTTLTNCQYIFGATAQKITLGLGIINIEGGTIAPSGSIPTALLNYFSGACTFTTIRGLDLSAVTGTLLTVSGVSDGYINLFRCKLGAGLTPVSGTFNNSGSIILRLRNCDSSNKNYRYYDATYLGTVIEEATITRVGGASDGTTPISLLVTSTANTKFTIPLVLPAFRAWNDLVGGSRTVTVELTTDTALTNAECGIRLEYLGNSSYPISSFSDTKAAWFATPVSLTTSSETWNGTAKTYKYKLQVSVTPQMKGLLVAEFWLAKASTPVYVCPMITVT